MTIAADQQTQMREVIKEFFYASGLRVLRPVVQVLNDEYPASQRQKTNPKFDVLVFDEHDQKFKRARNHLYEQRNLLQKKWLPRYLVSTGPVKDIEATTEMRNVVVQGALNRLYENLGAYIPMLVKPEHAKSLMAVVTNVYVNEEKLLTEIMEKYSAQFVSGTESMDKELD